MPTEKPRVTITMSNEQLKKIEAFRYDNKIKNQTQAILSLIENGFEALSLCNNKKTAVSKNNGSDSFTKNEQQLLTLYNDLNTEGQEKLIDYADDLVSSGKYIKTDPLGLVQDA